MELLLNVFLGEHIGNHQWGSTATVMHGNLQDEGADMGKRFNVDSGAALAAKRPIPAFKQQLNDRLSRPKEISMTSLEVLRQVISSGECLLAVLALDSPAQSGFRVSHILKNGAPSNAISNSSIQSAGCGGQVGVKVGASTIGDVQSH